MNKKVSRTLISLCWIFLVGFALLKTVGAEWFAAQVQNQTIINIGNYIDNNLWARIIADIIVGFIGGSFYFSACLQVWKLKLWQYGLVLIISVAIVVSYLFSNILGTILNFVQLIIVPILLKANWKQIIYIFIVHFLGQLGIMYIRAMPLLLLDVNYATQFIILFDGYIWYALYYLYSNYYKEVSLWENLSSFFSGIRQKKTLKKNSQK